jgi:chromosome segregation ATPase
MAPDLARTVIALHAELADAQAAQAALRAEIDRLTRWRAEEGEKIKRQAKALTDLTKHCQRIEAENAGLARKIGKVQRGDGDHSQIADLEAKVINQRNELANLRARDGRLAELAVERDTLAAANSMLEAKVEGLRSAFRVNMLRFGPPGTSHEEIDAAIDAALATQEAGNG